VYLLDSGFGHRAVLSEEAERVEGTLLEGTGDGLLFLAV